MNLIIYFIVEEDSMSSTMKDIVSRTNGELYIGVVGCSSQFDNTYAYYNSNDKISIWK